MSEINAYQESVFYHYILENQHLLNVTKPDFFANATLKELFEVTREHSLKYKSAPSKDQTIELLRIKGLYEKMHDNVETVYESKEKLSGYEDKWLNDSISAWIKVRNLDYVMRKAVSYMKLTKISSENAVDVVETVRTMLSNETAIDFTFNLGRDFFDAASHRQTRLARKSSGYNYIDLCLKGGYWKGALIVFFGMPKVGKSSWLCNLAAKSVLSGNNTAYITLELQEEIVHSRIGANLLNIPLDKYEQFAENETELKNKLNYLKANSDMPLGNLHVKEFPSSSAGAPDIEMYLKKAEEILGYKFDNIFIDYINIMKNWRNPNSENLYLKIKQISEDVRAMGMNNHWSMISVTQTNRCLAADTIVTHREKGKIQVRQLVEGDYILGDNGYTKVEGIYFNKDTKAMIIKTKSGKQIITSETHIFPIDVDNNIFKEVHQLTIGDMLYCTSNDIDLYKDEIVSIEEYGKIKTVDVVVNSSSKLFFANDILTHNCGWDKTDLVLSDLSESGGLLMTVDALFGLCADATMKANGEYYLKCMADRVAPHENTRKRFTMDWKYMRIEEDMYSGIQDLSINPEFVNTKSKQSNSSIPASACNVIPGLDTPTNNITTQSLDYLFDFNESVQIPSNPPDKTVDASLQSFISEMEAIDNSNPVAKENVQSLDELIPKDEEIKPLVSSDISLDDLIPKDEEVTKPQVNTETSLDDMLADFN